MDEQRFQRQLALEDQHQREGALKRVRKDEQNKRRNYGSHTTVGLVIRRELVGYLAQALKDEYQNRVMAGIPGKGYINLYGVFPKGLRWDVISHIGISTILDFVMIPRTPIHVVHRKIGQRIEDELMLNFFRKVDPELYKKCKKDYIRDTASYRQKVYSTAKVFRNRVRELQTLDRFDDADLMTWHRWPQDTILSVGAWITATADMVFRSLTDGKKFLERITFPGEKHQEHGYQFGPAIGEIEEIQREMTINNATYRDWPMVCEPIDWVLPSDEFPNGVSGGFVTNPMTKKYDLVRRGSSIPSQTAVDALNRLQKTAWRLNPFVFEIVQYFYRRGESINESDSFRPYMRPEDYDIPKLPPHLIDIPHYRNATTSTERSRLMALQNEQKKAKALLRKWHNTEAKRRKEGEIFRQVMTCAEKFIEEDRFWIPWSFDFRTRMYPISVLNPQSAQYINGMMMFADGHPLDDRSEYWLAVHLATTRGFSKETFEGRVSWVRGNLQEVTQVATDPLGRGRVYWTEQADEPWLYLAACKEYYDCYIAKTKSETHILCGIDATASGLQILGGLIGDTSTCRLVNVLPTEKPSDLYQAVIDKAIDLMKNDRPRRRNLMLDQLTRKVAKAPVMTLAYGSTEWTRKNQVYQAITSVRGLGLRMKWEQTEYIAKKIDDAIRLVLPGAEFALDWLQRCAVDSMKHDPDKKMVSWENASGCVIHQEYFEEQLKFVTSVALGQSKYFRPAINAESDDPKLTKIESSTAANVVHSCDAAVLHLTTSRLDFPVSMTHDCGYAQAGKNMDELAIQLRHAFVEVVMFPVLEKFAEMNGLPRYADEVTAKKNPNFDYGQIYDSQFLFC